jgi:epoxide hydrolase-like predicted phosphatase
MTIKTIIFDLGGVIVDLDYSNFYKQVIALSPLEKPQTQIMLEFFRQSDLYHQGKMTDEEFYKLACEILQVCMINQNQFYEAFNSIISDSSKPGMISLLKELRDMKKYKLIALSNVNSSHWTYLLNKKGDFLEYFGEFILSHEVHLTKPDPRIFQLAIEKSGCNAEEIVYVDDGLNNIRSANDLGIRGIYFTNVEDLIEEFKKLKIIIN